MKYTIYFSWLFGVIFFLSFITEWYGYLSLIAFIALILATLNKLGKGIVLREVIAIHTMFVCLIAPLWGYHAYDYSSSISRLWVKYMPVPEAQYFSFALPAVLGFVLLLTLPLKQKSSDEGILLQKLLTYAKLSIIKQPRTGAYLVITGLFSSALMKFLPEAMQFVAYLFFLFGFAGLIYLYYSPKSYYRIPALIIFGGYVLIDAIREGMFTLVAYMGLTIFSFFFLGRHVKLWKKTTWLVVGIFSLLILQLAKPVYRKMTWGKEYSGNKALLLGELVVEQATTLDLKSSDALFPIYSRTNQGFNVALVMRRIPDKQNYDYGSRLFLTFISAFVPRVVWPDKPEAGGKFNMQYYTALNIRGWSTNVGPLGEGYGSFGKAGGILFMMLLALFIRWAYAVVFRISWSASPLFIFWIPVLFYQTTFSAETDTLSIINSLVKATLLIWIVYKLLPSWFGIYKRPYKIMSSPRSSIEKAILQKT